MSIRIVEHVSALPAGGGAMGHLMRSARWPSAFPPAFSDWPQELQVAVTLMLNAALPIFIPLGEDHACLYNDGYLPILGQRHPAALGRPFQLVWPEIWDRIEPLVERARQGEPLFFEDLALPLERSDGLQQAYFTFSYSPFYALDGRIAGIFCACTETTEKVLTVAALRESQTALEAANAALEARVTEQQRERDRVWRLSRDLIAVASLDGYFRSVNPAFATLLGWTEAEALSKPFFDFVHPEEIQQVETLLGELRHGRSVTQVELRVLHKDGGYRWLSWTVVPEGETLSVVGRDVTADKEQRKALADAEEALRHAQKMEAVGQLTGGIAHDFNNLLTGIIGSLEMMRRRVSQGRPADIDRFATTAITSANRAAALTHRLLAFSRRQSLDPKPVDADQLVRGMADLFRRTIGAGIELEIGSRGELWPTFCDPHQLENAVLNLVINARDAMPDGGRLTIETSNSELDAADAGTAREIRPGQYVCLSVADTGTGMTADVASKAFDPFFTTKPIGQGTGLGLSMIYGFARQSGGGVRIASRVGQGTSLKIYLPRFLGDTSAPSVPLPGRSAGRDLSDRVVLVVEDEAMIRDLVLEVLDERGIQPLEAHDGPSGLRILQSDIRIDLLVTDVGLPGFDGRQLADAARTLRPTLKVLFMTGYAHNAAVGNGLLEPGMQVITKPFTIDALGDRIVGILGD